MSKLYKDAEETTIHDVPVYIEYVDYLDLPGGTTIYFIDAWVNKGTELEDNIAYSNPDEMLDELVEEWIDAQNAGEDW